MGRKQDARSSYVDEAILQAFMQVLATKPLAEMTMAEIAREADVSRSTLYAHYASPVDMYDAVVAKIPPVLRPLSEQLACDGCELSSDKQAFCDQLRHSGGLSAIFKEDRFLKTLLANDVNDANEFADSFGIDDLSKQEYEAIRLFQMSGCYAVATSELGRPGNWDDIRRTLDAFIAGGLANLRRQRLEDVL